MALGGFLGSDPAATVESIADDVADGDVRYVLAGGAGPGGGGLGMSPGTGTFPGGGSLPGAGGGPRPQLPPGNDDGGVQPPTGGFPAGNGGFSGGPGGSANDNSAIMSAVQEACTAVTADATTSVSGALYDCRGKADAIRDAETT